MLPRPPLVLRTVILVAIVWAMLPILWLYTQELVGGVAIERLNMTAQPRSQPVHLHRETSTFKTPTKNETIDDVHGQDSETTVNPHEFQYIHNPEGNICRTGEDVFLLIYIHTAPEHYKRRTSIRDTWGSQQNFEDEKIRLIFLMGNTQRVNAQAAVDMESEMYGDIVQEDFVDSYRNLTYKGIMGLKWISRHCKHARFLLKADDDIFVNIFNVVSHLRAMSGHIPGGVIKDLLLCLVWTNMKVIRDPRSKWYLSEEEFADEYFPIYCSGSAFILTTDVADAMYKASLQTPFFWVDDVYVTGFLAAKVGVKHQQLNSVYSLGPSTFLQKFTEPDKWRTLTFGHVHNLNHLIIVWNKVIADREQDMGD